MRTVIRTTLRQIAVLILTISANSCSNGLKHQYISFTNTSVSFPASMPQINQNIIYFGNSDNLSRKIPKFVIYIDSLDCTTCRVGKLRQYNDLQEKTPDYEQFQVVVILNPRKKDAEDMMQLIPTLGLEFPVFMDKEREFLKSNKQKPADERFDCFLLNKDNVPVFVGNPFSSPKLTALYEEQFNTLLFNN